MSNDSFGSRSTLEVGGREYEIHRIDALQKQYDVARLPYSLKVLLENALRLEDGQAVDASDVEAIATWDASAEPAEEIGPIKLVRKGKVKAPQGLRYTSYDRLMNAKTLDEAF